jgi:HEAT repeat protein
LTAGTPRTRAAAAHALAYVSADDACAALRCALRDSDTWVRYFAATSLGRRGDAAAVEDLVTAATGDAARQVRVAAVEAIGAIGGDRAIELLGGMAATEESDIASTALRALGSTDSALAVPILCAALRSPDARRRVAAADALACAVTPEAIDALSWTASADADPMVSRAAIAALGSIAACRPAFAAAAVHALVTVSTEAAARPDAIAALLRVPASAVPALGDVLLWDEPVARTVAVEVLARMAKPAASAYLVQALDDRDAGVRQKAVTALSRLGTRGVGRRLAALAKSDDSPAVRRAAELALARASDAEREL